MSIWTDKMMTTPLDNGQEQFIKNQQQQQLPLPAIPVPPLLQTLRKNISSANYGGGGGFDDIESLPIENDSPSIIINGGNHQQSTDHFNHSHQQQKIHQLHNHLHHHQQQQQQQQQQQLHQQHPNYPAPFTTINQNSLVQHPDTSQKRSGPFSFIKSLLPKTAKNIFTSGSSTNIPATTVSGNNVDPELCKNDIIKNLNTLSQKQQPSLINTNSKKRLTATTEIKQQNPATGSGNTSSTSSLSSGNSSTKKLCPILKDDLILTSNNNSLKCDRDLINNKNCDTLSSMVVELRKKNQQHLLREHQMVDSGGDVITDSAIGSSTTSSFVLPRVNLKTSTISNNTNSTIATTSTATPSSSIIVDDHSGYVVSYEKPTGIGGGNNPNNINGITNGHTVTTNNSTTAAAAAAAASTVSGTNNTTSVGSPNPLSTSHYSTEKSGSSGYYSSNIYSTNSFDDHIYSEPATVRIDAANNKNNNNNHIPNLNGTNKVLHHLHHNQHHNHHNHHSHHHRHHHQHRHHQRQPSTSTTLSTASSISSSNKLVTQIGGTAATAAAATTVPASIHHQLSASIAAAKSMCIMESTKFPLPGSSSSSSLNVGDQHHNSHRQLQQQGLVNLETSIKNLEMHLKSFSQTNKQHNCNITCNNNDGNNFCRRRRDNRNQYRNHDTHIGDDDIDDDDDVDDDEDNDDVLDIYDDHDVGDHHNNDVGVVLDQKYDKRKSVRLLPTIMEGAGADNGLQTPIGGGPPSTTMLRQWQEDPDDSLMDLDLDSFLLANEVSAANAASNNGGGGGGDTSDSKKKKTAKTNATSNCGGGVGGGGSGVGQIVLEPTVLQVNGIENNHQTTYDDSLVSNKFIENNYKCRKYVNSCPDDPYNVEGCIEDHPTGVNSSQQPSSIDKSLAFYLKKCEDQVHYQNTKDILEEIREKLNGLLVSTAVTPTATTTITASTTPTTTNSSNPFFANIGGGAGGGGVGVGTDGGDTSSKTTTSILQENIQSLKGDLDNYLMMMNKSNEMEIKQFCNGLSKNYKLLTIQNALENRSKLLGKCPDSSCINFNGGSANRQKQPIDDSSLEIQPYEPISLQQKSGPASNQSSYREREESQFDTVYVRDGFSFGFKSKDPFHLDFNTITSSQHKQQQQQQQQQSHHQQQHQHLSDNEIYGHNNYYRQQHHLLSETDLSNFKLQERLKYSPCSSCEEILNSFGDTTSSNSSNHHDFTDQLHPKFYQMTQMHQNMTMHHRGALGVDHFIAPTVVDNTNSTTVAATTAAAAAAGGTGAMIGNVIVNGVPMTVLTDDKDIMMDWHRNKPSIWELYYGTNRMSQTIFKKVKGQHSMMSLPSSRPESDFTLDLPRAEQLRIKMKKEKQFRHRCRLVTSFLSLVFFLLTVMVVSLILTRGKRMFGSMI